MKHNRDIVLKTVLFFFQIRKTRSWKWETCARNIKTQPRTEWGAQREQFYAQPACWQLHSVIPQAKGSEILVQVYSEVCRTWWLTKPRCW